MAGITRLVGLRASGLAASAVALAAMVGSAAAQAPSMGDVIKARQSHYKEIGGAMKGIVDEIKKPEPSVPAIQVNARKLSAYGPQIAAWFPTGSGAEAGLKTAAKAEIWAKPDEFKHDVQGFIDETKKFDAVASGGDISAIRAAMPALGGTCRTCHEAFRVREQ